MITALLAQASQPTRLPPLQLPKVQYSAILPELALVVGALVLLMVWSLVRSRSRAGINTAITIAAAAVSLVGSWHLWADIDKHGPRTAISGAIVVDGFSVFIAVLVGFAIILGALISDAYLRREQMEGPEFQVLLLLSASGAMLMAASNDLILLFLGLEILSLPLYILAGYYRSREVSREAAMKYFLLGAFSSALFLYGIAMVYGATGSTNLPEIASWLATNVVTSNGVMLAGMALLVVGLGFKVAAVPFHAWTPDVYQGAPTPVTGFMAAVAKAGGFAGLLRVFFSALPVLRLDWQPLIWALAVLTLVVGSVLAVVQTDIKRMLAYSSISHAGYVLIGLQAASKEGLAASLFYLFVYSFMVLGSFAVVTLVGRKGDRAHDLAGYRGVASSRPGLALTFTVFLMAQAGVPFTSGLLAKFYVIKAAVDSHSYALAIIGMLAAAIGAFAYLRVVILMYTPPAEGEQVKRLALPRTTGIALAAALAFTLVVGFFPSPVIDFARHATLLF
ncbi:MAG: NADH-quinone oxidoreductase subunit N [Actinobacteria bacterium]|nr:NADH-quinone oxidoreductase subunit N [Actinomycetota bacterium]